jgi:hypothetical protein
VNGQLHAPAALTPPRVRAPGTHCIGVWVDPRASLEDIETGKSLTLRGLELRPLGRPARSQSDSSPNMLNVQTLYFVLVIKSKINPK